MNPNEMTMDQCLRFFAEDSGWTRHEQAHSFTSPDDVAWASEKFKNCSEVYYGGGSVVWWEKLGEPICPRPEPPWFSSTLDSIASAMPEGWTWERTYQMDEDGSQYAEWCAWKHSTEIHMEDTGDEKLDRARLAVACRLAERGSK